MTAVVVIRRKRLSPPDESGVVATAAPSEPSPAANDNTGRWNGERSISNAVRGLFYGLGKVDNGDDMTTARPVRRIR